MNVIQLVRLERVHRLAVHANAKRDLLDRNALNVRQDSREKIARNVPVIRVERCRAANVKRIVSAR